MICDFAHNELRVHATTLGEIRLYVAAFGKHLFGSATHFVFKAKYTLAPLQERGREALNCWSIEGLDLVRLRELHWAWDGAFKHVEIQKASDLFMAFAVQQRTVPEAPKLVKAIFDVKLSGIEKPRAVMIRPPASASFGRGEEASLIEQWLREQRFVVLGEAAPNDEPEPALAID